MGITMSNTLGGYYDEMSGNTCEAFNEELL